MKRIPVFVLMILSGISLMAESQDGVTLRGVVLEKTEHIPSTATRGCTGQESWNGKTKPA